jgi:hypothetical protein
MIRKRLSNTFMALLFAFSGLTLFGAEDLQPPTFENAPEVTSESGYVKLSWEWNHPSSLKNEFYEFELQQSKTEGFENVTTLYRGPDFATFLSGLENGKYYHRVRVLSKDGKGSDWSNPVMVEIRHHSRQLAFTLFGLGAIVFLVTVGIVIQGSRSISRNR